KVEIAEDKPDATEKTGASKDLTKGATLSFIDPVTKEPAIASPAQVAMLLQREFLANGMETQANQVDVKQAEGAKTKEGRFSKMHFTIHDGVTPEQMKKVLAATKN